MKLGCLVPPLPTDHCANVDCERALPAEGVDAFLFKDLGTGKLVVFCEDCATYVELNARTQFALVAL